MVNACSNIRPSNQYTALTFGTYMLGGVLLRFRYPALWNRLRGRVVAGGVILPVAVKVLTRGADKPRPRKRRRRQKMVKPTTPAHVIKLLKKNAVSVLNWLRNENAMHLLDKFLSQDKVSLYADLLGIRRNQDCSNILDFAPFFAADLEKFDATFGRAFILPKDVDPAKRLDELKGEGAVVKTCLGRLGLPIMREKDLIDLAGFIKRIDWPETFNPDPPLTLKEWLSLRHLPGTPKRWGEGVLEEASVDDWVGYLKPALALPLEETDPITDNLEQAVKQLFYQATDAETKKGILAKVKGVAGLAEVRDELAKEIGQ